MKKIFSAGNIALLFAASLLTAQPVLAASVSDAGAADVKKQVEDALAFPLNLQKITGGGLSMTGGVDVAAKGDYYEVKLNGLSFAQSDMGLKASIGTITGNVTPGDQGEFKVTFTLPSSVSVTDDRQAPVAELSIGSQQFTGTWWPKYHAFTQIDAAYSGLKLESKKEDQPFAAEIGSFKDSLVLTPAGDIWSGPSKFEVSQIHLNAGKKGLVALTIDSITGQADYDKMNLAVYRQMEEKTAQILADAEKSKQPDAQQSQNLVSSMMTGLQTYLDGMATQMTVTNASLTVAPGAPDAGAPGAKPVKPFAMQVAKLSTGMTVTGMQQEKGSLALSLGLDGLNVQDPDATIAGVIPTAAHIEVHLDNMPLQAMTKQFSGLFSQVINGSLASGKAGDPGQKAALQQQLQAQVIGALGAVPAQLTAAGAKLSVVNTYTKAPDLTSSVDGAFTANAASPLMAEGSISLVLTGLDELMLKVQSLISAPGADPRAGGWYQGLGLMQMMGQLGKAADGRSQRTYKIDVTPEGKTLLNGQDLLGAMGGMGGAHGGAPSGIPGGAPGGAPAGTPAPQKQPTP